MRSAMRACTGVTSAAVGSLGMTYIYKNYCECPILQSARADGHALGGGFMLTLCCDYRLAVADDASCFIDAHLTNRCGSPIKAPTDVPLGSAG